MKYKKVSKDFPEVSCIGQGTGFLPHDIVSDSEAIKALRLGIDMGMTFIDTAENYLAGHSEELIGKAMEGIREKVFIATKFSPENNSYQNVLHSAQESLRRLKTDYVDLYQVHWPNSQIPIEETMAAMEELVKQGKIRHIGISNFSIGQMQEAQKALSHNKLFSIEMEYNLFDRFIEKDIIPYCQKENIAIIAYSPLDQGRIFSSEEEGLKVLQSVAQKYGKTVSQVVLNWLVAHPTVIAIPKTTEERYIRENASATDFEMSKEDFDEISRIYTRQTIQVPVEEIHVSPTGQGNRKVYQTLVEALENKLNFVPSPKDLAKYIKDHPNEEIKPVRLISVGGSSSKYDLVEGRVRYWAWVIAHEGKKPIPAYVRTNF